MGIQLNLGDHLSKVDFWFPIPPENRAAAQWARTQARDIASRVSGANRYFRNLPRGKSLSELLNDSTIWVNYMNIDVPLHGQSGDEAPYRELAIGYWAFRAGKRAVLGTLIHELAHINGAPGFPSLDAELAVYYCGLGTAKELKTGVDDPSTPYTPGHRG